MAIRDIFEYVGQPSITLGAGENSSATLGVGTIQVLAAVTLERGNAYAIDASGNASVLAPSEGLDQSARATGVYTGEIQIPEGSSTVVGAATGVYTTLKKATFDFTNSTTNAITAAHCGGLAYFDTGTTVANTAATYSPKAGIILGLTDGGTKVTVDMTETQ